MIKPKVYPSWRYHKTHAAKVVHSARDDRNLDEAWKHSPADFETEEMTESEPVEPKVRKPRKTAQED